MSLRTLDTNTNSRIGDIWLRKHYKGSDGPNLIFRKSELNCSRVSMAGDLVGFITAKKLRFVALGDLF